MFAAAWVVIEAVPDSTSDNAWLTLTPAVFTLGLAGIGFGIVSLLPSSARARASSGLIFGVVVLGTLNLVLLSGWALTAERDLNKNEIRPPLIRAISVLAAATAAAVVAGQFGRSCDPDARARDALGSNAATQTTATPAVPPSGRRRPAAGRARRPS